MQDNRVYAVFAYVADFHSYGVPQTVHLNRVNVDVLGA